MAKVNKAFSLDPEVFVILDKYCASHEEIGGKRKSRSAVVNNAIRWYLGDTANLVNQRDVLQRELLKRSREVEVLENRIGILEEESLQEEFLSKKNSSPRSWWRRLLGLN
tara:strand:- start:1054 stop:1383 length:330 start_codon:yes stop_codon:yes gene_type:complete